MTQNSVIGITGITGSGTSTVSAILAERGGYIISADKLAREVIQKGQPAYDEVVRVFGSSVIADSNRNQEIDRKALGAMVFGNPEKLALLESIIHPAVISRVKDELSHNDAPFVVIDAPLLIESGLHKLCNSVWLVTARDDVRLARIMSRDGISIETARQRLNSRAGDDILRPYANVIIENNADIASLRVLVERNQV